MQEDLKSVKRCEDITCGILMTLLLLLQFVDMMVESLKENLALGNYEKVRKLVRFLADLVNSKVVASASIMNLFDTFITVTYEPDIPQVCVCV